MRKTSAQPLSGEALEQLGQLRERGETFGQLAAQVPCSSATLWKAAAGGTLARPMRWLIELRLKELTQSNPALVTQTAA